MTPSYSVLHGCMAAYLYSDGAAVFSDVRISKLRPYGDI